MTQRAPEPGRLDEQLEADVALERLVAAHCLVANDRVGDVAVDVERGGACGPVARALVTADRPPREDGAGEPELSRALTCEVERGVAPTQGVSGRLRSGIGEHRQD